MRAMLICVCACSCLAVVGCGDDDDAAVPDAGIDGGDTDTDTDTDSDSDSDSDVDTSTEAVVHYKFDSCDGTTPDEMGTGLDAVLNGDATCGADDSLSNFLGASWSSGTALICDGHYDNAGAPDDPRFEPNQFTLSAWVYSDDFGACYGGLCEILSKGNSDEPALGYRFLVNGSNNLLRLCLGAEGEDEYTSFMAGELSTSTWHHVAATFDGSTIALFLDGVQTGTTETEHGVEYGDEDFLVGALSNRPYSFAGYIDEVILWNYAKSADEVAELYESYVGTPDGGVDGGTDAG